MTLRLPLPRSPRPLWRAAVLALGIGCIPLAGAAAAAQTPQFLPESDVRIRYTVNVPNRPSHDYDLSFSAGSQRLRIDDPARGLWFLVDLRDASAALVVPAMHVVVTDADLANLATLLQAVREARFTRLGEATIAGLRCTRYQVSDQQVNGRVCLTRNGIALSLSGEDAHGSADAVADSVSEVAVPADALVPPAGFTKIALPPAALQALLGD